MFPGLIVPSFGRIVDMIAALEKQHLVNEISAPPPIFYFPDKHRFPFLSTVISLKMKLSDKKFYAYANKIGRRYFPLQVPSMSDFEKSAGEFYKAVGQKAVLTEGVLSTLTFDYFEELLSSRQININKLVLLYVRNADWDIFWNKLQDKDSLASLEHRNTELHLFTPTIYGLLQSGYSVIRIGRDRQRLRISSPGYFDYASSDLACDIYDFWLWKRCLGAISTGGGAHQPGILLGKPIFLANNGESIHSFKDIRRSHLRILPKVYYWTRSERNLSVDEIVELGIMNSENLQTSRSLLEIGVKIRSNSPEILLTSSLEFLEELSQKQVESPKELSAPQICKTWTNLQS